MEALATRVPKLARLNALKNVAYESAAQSMTTSGAHEDAKNCSLACCHMPADEEVEKKVELLCNLLASSPSFLGIEAFAWNAQQQQALAELHSSNNAPPIDAIQVCSHEPSAFAENSEFGFDSFSEINQNFSNVSENSSRNLAEKASTSAVTAQPAALRSCLKRPPGSRAARLPPSKSVTFIVKEIDSIPDPHMSQPDCVGKKSHVNHAIENCEDAHVKFVAKRATSHKKGGSNKAKKLLSQKFSSDPSEEEGFGTEFPSPVSESLGPENSKEKVERTLQEVSYDPHSLIYYQIFDQNDSQNSLSIKKTDNMAAGSQKNSHASIATTITCCGVETGKSSGLFSTSGDSKQESTRLKKHDNSDDSVVPRKMYSKEELPPESQQKRPWKFWSKGDHLGSGSLAIVYEGVSSNGRYFAVKKICFPDQRKASHRYVSRLEQEICSLCQLEHDNIVKYLGSESLRRLSPANSRNGGSHWVAPEAKDAEHCGLLSDIWSLGCTVLEMITRSPPAPDMDPV
ncbi:hypothetical protein O6H91_08G015500 [Diphasiastrum complanatum]|uniref:Uncharacterized protein n=3 Tax=Diphasiastrum complanatum TaxID=34168 RepID=A0ACC2CVA3_DIPCM|nr:hypothetical protein O6H91_08G015500 [Diphasiastrum complanatum]KAJ7545897.1 hypothetical protein O6H91_08G015500 [Diphasiastrum complanatum]KAJ7545898.1 hypothetical protein O6H91_08G015500 [Diphasiastrum complanatum]